MTQRMFVRGNSDLFLPRLLESNKKNQYLNCLTHWNIIKFLGSGKRALLEVISRRTRGPTRGEILLNGAPMSTILFQHNCGYVTHKCDLIPSLTVMQTLHFASNLTIGSKVPKKKIFFLVPSSQPQNY